MKKRLSKMLEKETNNDSEKPSRQINLFLFCRKLLIINTTVLSCLQLVNCQKIMLHWSVHFYRTILLFVYTITLFYIFLSFGKDSTVLTPCLWKVQSSCRPNIVSVAQHHTSSVAHHHISSVAHHHSAITVSYKLSFMIEKENGSSVSVECRRRCQIDNAKLRKVASKLANDDNLSDLRRGLTQGFETIYRINGAARRVAESEACRWSWIPKNTGSRSRIFYPTPEV